MKRRLTARALTTRPTASLTDRGLGRLRIGRVQHDHVGVAAECCHRGGKPADEGHIGRAFENVAAGIVARVHQEVGARRCARQRLRAPKCLRRRRRHRHATSPRDRRGQALPWTSQLPPASRSSSPAPYVPGDEPKMRARDLAAKARGIRQRIFRGVFVTRGDGGRGRVDQCDLRREHVAKETRDAPGHIDARPAQTRRRQHVDCGDATGRGIPLRAAAHQPKPLRDLLAAGAQRGAAPKVDDQRARPVAVILPVAAQNLLGSRLAKLEGGRRRHGTGIGGEEVAAGGKDVFAPTRRRAGGAGGDMAAIERRKQRPTLGLRAFLPQRVGLAIGCAAKDVEPVLDGKILEVAEPGVDAAQRLVRRVRRRPHRPPRRCRCGRRCPRSASPAGRGGGGRARRPAHIRRPAVRASACPRPARLSSSGGGRWPSVTAAMRRLACAASPGLLTMKG